jgi:small-conductance mechanosensitive channel
MLEIGWRDVTTVALIVVAAGAGYLALRTAIRVGVRHVLDRSRAGLGEQGHPPASADRERRILTLQGQSLRIAAVAIGLIALLTVLHEFSVDIGPAIAGLGIVGIAVGFGAQTLIRDWLAGVFIILENQYNLGDMVRIAGVSGVVEDLSLRRTVLRDTNGTIHIVPNGQIVVASNLTQAVAADATSSAGPPAPPGEATGPEASETE